ncbi:MAG: hypothetical protein ACI97A_001043 [Planctomycetota bacterium]|jgi:hypothetical protein
MNIRVGLFMRPLLALVIKGRMMSQNKVTLLDRALGQFEGPNLLWFEDPKQPEESVSKLLVSANRIQYDWQFRGDTKTGTLDFTFDGQDVEVTWVDTFHAKEAMTCTGTHDDEVIKVVCQYGAEYGDPWSWRTEIRSPGADQLLIEMYNIHPDGKEDIAVRINAPRIQGEA